jgi:transcriptional regulator with XRE-family HTH domain
MVSSEELLRRRVQALLDHSGRTRKDMSVYLGKSQSWATDFFHGRHGVTLKDLDRLARFFGVSVPSLFELDGFRFRDRRRVQRRRCGKDRRVAASDRRKSA